MNYLLVPAWVFDALQYAAVLLALGAGALLAVAFFSTRRGWEPRCRRCAHDLRSVDPTTGACPECGAELSKIGAVQAGQRRVRPMVATVGCVLLALTVLAAWKLDAAGARTVRARLIASMPTQTLVDALFEGGQLQQPAQAALIQKRVLTWNTQRVLPTGELLELVLHAADRCDEPGRRPLAAVLQSEVREILVQLDTAEIDTLVDLAAEELVASGGGKTTRYQLAIATAQVGDRIIDRLNATPEGRRVIAMRPTAPGELTAGALETITLRQALVRSSRRVGGRRAAESDLSFICSEAMLESPDGAVRRPLAVAARQRLPSLDRNEPNCNLLIDAPPGKYRLTVKGALAKTMLLPRAANLLEGATTVTVDDALKLEGSSAFEGSCEVVVAPPVPDARLFTNDAGTVEKAAQVLAKCRLEDRGGSATIDFSSLTEPSGNDERVPAMTMLFTARQAGRTWRLGTFFTAGRGHSASIGSLPSEMALTEPFEFVVEPITASHSQGSRASVRRGGEQRGSAGGEAVPFVWATFTLNFENAAKPPQVAVTHMPLTPSTGTPRADDATRRAVAGWAESLGTAAGRLDSLTRPGDHTPVARTINLGAGMRYGTSSDGTTVPERDPEHEYEWPKELCLAGWIELWSGDRLAAEVQPIFGSMATVVSLPSLTPMFPVADDAMLVVRYRPDATVGAADGSGPFAFVSAPFELRFASKSASAELVWLDRAPSSRAEERKTP